MKSYRLKLLVLLLIFAQDLLFSQTKIKDIELPTNYEFTWIMTMEMETEKAKKKPMKMMYYMKEDATYFGLKNDMLAQGNPDAEMFIVMDANIGVTSVFMDMMGKKIIQKTALNNEPGNHADNNDYVYKKIEGKTILGYACEGFTAENDLYKIIFYISNDVPISFTKVWGTDTKSLPKTFDTSWLKDYADKGAVLEMQFEDKKKKKYNSKMICTSLKKVDFKIDTTQYKSMF